MTDRSISKHEQFLRRLIELSAEMGEFYETECVPSWFFEPQKIFRGKRPIDMIEDDSDWDELSLGMAALRDGAFI